MRSRIRHPLRHGSKFDQLLFRVERNRHETVSSLPVQDRVASGADSVKRGQRIPARRLRVTARFRRRTRRGLCPPNGAVHGGPPGRRWRPLPVGQSARASAALRAAGHQPGGRRFLASQTIDRIGRARLAALRAAVPVSRPALPSVAALQEQSAHRGFAASSLTEVVVGRPQFLRYVELQEVSAVRIGLSHPIHGHFANPPLFELEGFLEIAGRVDLAGTALHADSLARQLSCQGRRVLVGAG